MKWSKNLEILIILISTIQIILALVLELDYLFLFGASLYFLVLLFDFVVIIISARKYKKGIPLDKLSESKIVNIGQGVLVTFIQFSGMFLMFSDNNLLFLSGVIIWPGTLLFYLLSGWIARDYLNIPIRMGYGGWKAYNPKKKF